MIPMEDLITAVNAAIDELEGYYDGAPDSKTLWLGSIIVDLREAASKAERCLKPASTLLLLLCLTGCVEPPTTEPFIGATVTVPDGRQGEVIGNYAENMKTQWLVKLENPQPKPGQRYTTEVFRDSELSVQR
jgi:hypothetical protein